MTKEKKIEKLRKSVPDKCESCEHSIKTEVVFEECIRVTCPCFRYSGIWSLPGFVEQVVIPFTIKRK